MNRLYLISFIEGGSLMAVELLAAKLFQSHYGQSLYVWSAVLAVTVGSLSVGYALGARLSKQATDLLKVLHISLLLPGIYILLLPWFAPFIEQLTLQLPLLLGITLCALLIISPIVIAFGTVTPIIVQYFTKEASESGQLAGNFYFISTMGGVVYTFLFGFFLMPTLGVRLSLLIVGGILILCSFMTQRSYIPLLKSILWVLMFSSLLVACGRDLNTDQALIKGTIMGGDGKQLNLFRYTAEGKIEKIRTSSIDKKGKIEILLKLEDSTIFYLENNKSQKRVYFHLKPEAIFEFSATFLDFDNYRIIQGNGTTKALQDFHRNYGIKRNEYTNARYLANQSDIVNRYRAANIEIEKRYDIAYMDMKNFLRTYADTIQINDLVYYATSLLNQEDFHFVQSKTKTLDESVMSSYLKKRAVDLKTRLNTFLPVVEAMPLLSGSNGEQIPLYSPTDHHTLVLVWASWCHESANYISKLMNSTNTFKEKNINIVSISLDEEKDKWKTGLTKLNFEADHHYCDEKGWQTPLKHQFPFDFIPANFLISPEGNLHSMNMSVEELLDFSKTIDN